VLDAQSIPALIRRHAANAGAARTLFHGVALSGLLGVGATVSAGAAPLSLLLLWLLAYGVLAVVLELILRLVSSWTANVVTAGDYAGAIRGSQIAESLVSPANEIDLLSGTLRTFCERAADIRALHDRWREGASVRILMMAPNEDGAKLMAQERSARGLVSSAKAIDEQIVESIRRLYAEFPMEMIEQVVRLYPTAPHSSAFRYDDAYVVTVYTFGRGGSSPTLFLHRSGHVGFCESLDRGFRELWNAPTTKRLDKSTLARLGIE